MTPPEPRPSVHGGVAFLLSQLGAHAAERFASRLQALGLTPPQAGLLRQIAHHPERSQQEHAGHMGIRPSRFVAFVDDLQHRGLITRRRAEADRRAHTLHLTPQGEAALKDLRDVAEAHEDALCAGLPPADRATLAALLHRIADDQGLTSGVHPQYRHM